MCKVFEGVDLDNWAVICIGRMRENPDEIARVFGDKMVEMGLNVQGSPQGTLQIDQRDVSSCFQNLVGDMKGAKPPLFICPLADERSYGDVKKYGDRLGITTQCLLPRKMYKGGRPNHQYVSNVVLKIISKLGGIDKVVHTPGSDQHLLQSFFNAPTMVCGLAMSEDAPGSRGELSVVCLVGSLDMFADKFAHSCRNVRKGMREIE